MKKRVAYRTFGCRLNQYDTESVRTLLERDGKFETASANVDADVYVVNTCSVTARADATARKAIRRIHAEHPGAEIVVTGCYAQRAPADLASLPGVSHVVGAGARDQIPALVSAPRPNQARVSVPPLAEATKFLDVPITEMMEHSRAFVKVQEGCNERCTFCIVPQTRGVSRSREPASVLRQVRELVASGYVELVLTGVHVGDYGLDLDGERGLSALIEEILAVPGVERFRLSSIEPASFTAPLIDLAAREPRFSRHFHIPFQSGSDAILAAMQRRYRAAQFAELVEELAARIPGVAIGADVICGFPGESDADFQATFDAVESLPVTHLHPFSYSVRPGSDAEPLGDPVPPGVKKRRVTALKRLVREKQRRFCEGQVGERAQVLVEAGRPGAAGQGGAVGYSGWTDNYLRVSLHGADASAAGTIVAVDITAATADGLEGVVVGDPAGGCGQGISEGASIWR